MNAEIAIEAAEYLLRGESIQKERWPETVASVCWEGRMEEAGDHLVFSTRRTALCRRLFYHFCSLPASPVIKYRYPVFAAAADKKYESMIECLCRDLPVKAYIATEIQDKRKVPAEKIADVFRWYTEQKVLVSIFYLSCKV